VHVDARAHGQRELRGVRPQVVGHLEAVGQRLGPAGKGSPGRPLKRRGVNSTRLSQRSTQLWPDLGPVEDEHAQRRVPAPASTPSRGRPDRPPARGRRRRPAAPPRGSRAAGLGLGVGPGVGGHVRHPRRLTRPGDRVSGQRRRTGERTAGGRTGAGRVRAPTGVQRLRGGVVRGGIEPPTPLFRRAAGLSRRTHQRRAVAGQRPWGRPWLSRRVQDRPSLRLRLGCHRRVPRTPPVRTTASFGRLARSDGHAAQHAALAWRWRWRWRWRGDGAGDGDGDGVAARRGWRGAGRGPATRRASTRACAGPPRMRLLRDDIAARVDALAAELGAAARSQTRRDLLRERTQVLRTRWLPRQS
jgi:hypothetical protein